MKTESNYRAAVLLCRQLNDTGQRMLDLVVRSLNAGVYPGSALLTRASPIKVPVTPSPKQRTRTASLHGSLKSRRSQPGTRRVRQGGQELSCGRLYHSASDEPTVIWLFSIHQDASRPFGLNNSLAHVYFGGNDVVADLRGELFLKLQKVHRRLLHPTRRELTMRVSKSASRSPGLAPGLSFRD
jgi:hypothetical protein